MRDNINQPIFITGAQRSGTSLVARILEHKRVHTGVMTPMKEKKVFENLCSDILLTCSSDTTENKIFPCAELIPTWWKSRVEELLTLEKYNGQNKWMYKSHLLTQTWKIWHHAYPNAKWIIVRRKTPDIINSCLKTGFMKTFKNDSVLQSLGLSTPQEGWLWLIHQYEQQWIKMIEAGVNCTIIWPERMVDGDYTQIHQMLEWIGLKWDTGIVNTLDPLLNNNRR